jgi:tetratricopeptide (TPR) repeat protein
MSKKPFIRRVDELKSLRNAVISNAEEREICFLYDAAPDKNEKGGVGKTVLLKELLEDLTAVPLSERDYLVLPEIIDLYEPANRSRPDILYTLVHQLEDQAVAHGFNRIKSITSEFFSSWADYKTEENTAQPARFHELDSRLVDSFVSALTSYHKETNKRVVCFIDSFEYIEDDETFFNAPGAGLVFPMSALRGSAIFVIAGRNAPKDWATNWWSDRPSQSILGVPLATFNQEQVEHFLEDRGYHLPEPFIQQLTTLTKGRPILLALAVDLMQQGKVKPEQLVGLNKDDFVAEVIRFLGVFNNVGWKRPVLYMAHFLHRFDRRFLTRFFGSGMNNTSIEEIADLAFVRELPGCSPKTVVLHDELRKMIVKYWWNGSEDADGKTRRDLSKNVLELYDEELIPNAKTKERLELQGERLHHQLFADFFEGFLKFEELFKLAISASSTEGGRTAASFYLRIVKDFRRDFENEFDKYPELSLYVDHYFTAEVFVTQGLLDAAIGLLEEGIQKLKGSLDAERMGRLYELKAYCHRLKGDWKDALIEYDLAIRASREAKQVESLTHNQLLLANVLMLRGELTRARELCSESIYLRERFLTGNESDALKIERGITYYVMGMILWRMRVTPSGPGYFKKAGRLFKEIEDPDYVSIARIHNAISNKEWGYMCLTSGILSPSDYIGFLDEALKIFEEAKMYSEWADALNMRARVDYMQLKVPERSIKLSKQALTLAKLSQDNYRLCECHLTLAFSYLEAKDHTTALSHCDQGETIADDEGYILLKSWFQNVRARSALMTPDYEKAFRSFVSECLLSIRYEGGDVRFRRALEALESALLMLPSPEYKLQFATYVKGNAEEQLELMKHELETQTTARSMLDLGLQPIQDVCDSVLETANLEMTMLSSSSVEHSPLF